MHPCAEPAAIAPSDWYYPLFPLSAVSEEEVSLDWLVEQAASRLKQAQDADERAYLGPVLHWAHLLKFEQGPEGDWPALVNARTGTAVGEKRTRAPGELMAALAECLLSSEFDEAVKLARSVQIPIQE